MPDVQKAMQDAVKRLKALGKPAGILTGNEEEARRYIDWGYLFVAVGADVGLLAKQCRRARQEIQELTGHSSVARPRRPAAGSSPGVMDRGQGCPGAGPCR